MDIQSVKTDHSVVSDTAANQKKQQAQADTKAAAAGTTRRSDTLVLSQEAKKLQPYQAKLTSGYYDKPEVLKATALKISQQIQPNNTSGTKINSAG